MNWFGYLWIIFIIIGLAVFLIWEIIEVWREAGPFIFFGTVAVVMFFASLIYWLSFKAG